MFSLAERMRPGVWGPFPSGPQRDLLRTQKDISLPSSANLNFQSFHLHCNVWYLQNIVILYSVCSWSRNRNPSYLLVALTLQFLLLVAGFQNRIARFAENFVLLIVAIQAGREHDLRC